MQQEALETQLAQHKTNLIKESIRLGHCDLGNHHYACGQLQVGPSAGGYAHMPRASAT